MELSAFNRNDIVYTAINVLKDKPLCDRCLGRLFARLGLGFSNKERGETIKRMIVMYFHQRILSGDQEALSEFKELAPRLGVYAKELYKNLFGVDLTFEQCYICSSNIDDLIEKATIISKKLLEEWDIKKFVVGARVPFETITREEQLKLKHGIVFSESIRNEVKREVGKKLVKHGFEVDFDNPEATLLIELWEPKVSIQVNPLFLVGRYWKLGRNISQSYWPTRKGVKYDFSVEQATWVLKDFLKAEKTVIHAAGREDADARMIGTGRPLVIEVKKPKKRHVNLKDIEDALNLGGKSLVHFKIDGLGERKIVRLLKEESSVRKLYKAIIVSENSLSRDEIVSLDEYFKLRTIKQQTPKRVLHRRSDKIRMKKVYEVKSMLINENVFISIILAEGGLYIKELINGDDGRTDPSFSSYLQKSLTCVDLDVLGVDLGYKLVD